MFRYIYILISTLLLCHSPAFAKLSVCTTTSFVRDLAESIGREHVSVTSLMGPGVDPHLYKASINDLKILRRSNVILYNGLHLEGRMTDVFEAMKRQGKPAYAITKGIDHKELISLGEHSNLHDPHVWLDPQLWSLCAKTVADILIKHDPNNKAQYRKNLQHYLNQLESLHSWALSRVGGLSKDKRILITSHDAYNYFGKAFDFQVIGVQGVSTASEAGLADIVSTIDYIKKHKVKAIFVESSVSPATINRISQESGAVVGGQLFSDSLGDKPPMDTYIGTFKHNLNTIIDNLK